jgi:hypothetical protein
MTRPLLIVLLMASLPASVMAQTAGGGTEASRRAVSEHAKSVDPVLEALTRSFYEALLARNIDALMLVCRPPFHFEALLAHSTDELRRRWTSSLQGRSLHRGEFQGFEVLTPEEMVQKYGKAPEKLAGWSTRGGMLSVGNLGGRAAIVLWRRAGASWQAVAFHD